ncbi:discoidin domain-containing protein [Streptomyces sp. NBC_00322]|uniref:discoidin domain-containing protein n=1 Tax=Streptomyces sp. NBC_00322 TaxID=2975712 RepID=UPI002E28701B|nr:discoidin domain-containing protein [Streptomyces sp. NBC_00322]
MQLQPEPIQRVPEHNALPGHHHSVVPAAATVSTAAYLPRTGWTATASDEETTGVNGRAANVLDGKADTIWHSRWSGTPQKLPRSITIDMHRPQTVSALVYQPRQSTSDKGSANGRIGQYEISLSTDGKNWTSVSRGTLTDDATVKTLEFTPQSARYVQLIALTEAGNRGPWASAAEINLTPPTAPLVNLPRTDWTATASDEETTGVNGRAANVLDGKADTIWHSRWSGTPQKLPRSITIDMHRPQTVSALVYQPRLSTSDKGSANGRIGQYEINLSTDGKNWTSVSRGTLTDDATVKTLEFTPQSARYVQLIALTEAGNRGPWASAAEINLAGPADPAEHGSWGPKIDLPLVPAAAAVLPNNKLLLWSSNRPASFVGDHGYTQTAILDLTTGNISASRINVTHHDMFCPGTAILADGRVLVTGGKDSDSASIYDPYADKWSSTTKMNIPRGYQAMTPLSTGKAFVLGGSWSDAKGGKDGEVWSPVDGSWHRLKVPVTSTLTQDEVFRSDNHQWLYAFSNGRVLQFGPSKQMNWIETEGDGDIKKAADRADSGDAMNGNGIAYDVNKLLTLGGAPHYELNNATNHAYTLELTHTDDAKQPEVKAQRTGDMAFPRTFSNSVVMPDGKVAVFGGQAYSHPFTDDAAVLTPELWDPETGKFTPLASMRVPRTYHSEATLLPDGRIFTGGGGLCPDTCSTNHPDGQIFTPPYLINKDGTKRSRPEIDLAPTTAENGKKITVTTKQVVKSFVLVRTSVVTHSTNNDQRRIPLTSEAKGANNYELSIPGSGTALPGTYMLFALDGNGTPSVAKVMKINTLAKPK